ncbi:MAG: CcmD family protein [Bacteroidota bacterium]
MRFLLLSICLIITLSGNAQSEVAMADGLRAEGKIYVVVAILLLILAGLIGYLVFVDKKLSRLEKKLSEKP